MAKMKQVIGIDLGTTNCALSYAEARPLDAAEGAGVERFDIPQSILPSQVRSEPLLPSCLFLYGENDFATDAIARYWQDDAPYLAGVLAKNRGAEVPSRLVASAKSWLCHSAVDRTAAILPVAADAGMPKLSPVEASRRFLEHMRVAWNVERPDVEFAEQSIVVTVPASFDAVARDLTLRAATEAGYPEIMLLEEPQAAFYAWLERHPDWRTRVAVGDLILVVDVGGGTTDFSLMKITGEAGQLGVERVAVGDHILLGGDNMDLALAHTTAQRLAESGKKLNAMQFQALWQNCRNGKEKLLSDAALDEFPVTIPGTGSGLIGGAVRAKIRREDVEQLVLDGFFPRVKSDEMTARQPRAAIGEMGLPYAADAAVTRHLASFLRRAGEALEHKDGAIAKPTHLLFNGGVFQAGLLRERLLEVLNSWLTVPVSVLDGEDLMHGVSRGATYYGLTRLGGGVKIRGGISRSYYIGIQPSMPAVPGFKPPLKALAVAQYGMEEGTKIRVSERQFNLLVGEAADFRFFESMTRRDDPPGLLLDEVDAEMEELAPIEVTLPAAGDSVEVVPVTLETEITETGQLQFWCTARDGRRWKLEFNVRETIR